MKLNKEEINKFLLSTGFIFQGLDRVQFFSLDGELVGDTNILDLDPKVFLREDPVLFNLQNEDGNLKIDNENNFSSNQEKLSDNLIKNINNGSFVTQGVIKKNFVVSTYNKIEIDNNIVGFIKVSEQANDILIAVEERKNFIIRTVLAIALLILIFSLFLNKYILKPLKFLSNFTESIKDKSNKNVNIEKLFIREDEIGKLTKSIDEMTKELQKRANRAETFSSDLAHEIRNPLAS